MNLKIWTSGAAIAVAAFGSSVYGSHPPTDPKIASYVSDQMTNKARNIPILVRMKKQADLGPALQLTTKEEKGKFVYETLRTTALAGQADLIKYLTEQNLKYRPFYIENTVAVFDASATQIEAIAARDDVLRVLGNPKFAAPLPKGSSAEDKEMGRGIETSLTRTGADKVWSEFSARGEGIVVAGQDTGVEWKHPALKNSYRGFKDGNVDHNYSWHDAIKQTLGSPSNKCGYDSKEPCDDDQHGTHTMGTMVGDDGAGNQVGMAPKAQWIACRNMDAGKGTPSTYLDCFEFFLAPYPLTGNPLRDGDPTKAPHVMNNSWGCPKVEGCEGDEFLSALKALRASGVFVVASAGNDGGACSTIKDGPAYHSDDTFSVGAVDHRSDKIASFSSRGPSTFDNKLGPDISAPGVGIRSSVPGGKFAGGFMWSGTSMAGPHVVGGVALLWSAKKDLIGKIKETSDVLAKTADGKTSTQTCGNIPGTSIPNNTFGYGIMNIYNAVKSVR